MIAVAWATGSKKSNSREIKIYKRLIFNWLILTAQLSLEKGFKKSFFFYPNVPK